MRRNSSITGIVQKRKFHGGNGGEIWSLRSMLGGWPPPRKQYEQMLSSRSKWGWILGLLHQV